jgi:hypothetical protein
MAKTIPRGNQSSHFVVTPPQSEPGYYIDEEVPKLSPPPPPPPQNRIIKIPSRRSVSSETAIALKFYFRGVMLRCFVAWRILRQRTKKLMLEAWVLMRRTWFLWRQAAMSSAHRRRSIEMLQATLHTRCVQMVYQAWCHWMKHARHLRMLYETFYGWRSHTQIEVEAARVKDRIALRGNFQRVVRTRVIYLRLWRSYTSNHVSGRENIAVLIMAKRNICVMGNVLRAFRSYAASMGKKRRGVLNLTLAVDWARVYAAFKRWQGTVQKGIRIEGALVTLSRVVILVHGRYAVCAWRCKAAYLRRVEHAMISKIFNRWSIHVEEKKRYRSSKMLATRFWAFHVCKGRFDGWRVAVADMKMERGASFLGQFHGTSNLSFAPAAVSTSSLLGGRVGGSYEMSKKYAPTLSNESERFAGTATSSLGRISTQWTRRSSPTSVGATVPRSSWLRTEGSYDSYYPSAPHRFNSRLSHSTTAVSRASSYSTRPSSPFGVKVPSWMRSGETSRTIEDYMHTPNSTFI